jgi:UDP-glucuronate decarboxylase
MVDDIILQDLQRIKKESIEEAFEGKNVLVTGGAGFIGSWICDVLVNLRAKVTCVDDLSTGRMVNIDHLIKKPNFSLAMGSACTFQSDDKFDFVFHLAGHASPEEYQTHPIETLQTSSLGSANMAELARKNDATILFASTSEIYGNAEVIPTPETYWGKVNPIGPRSCYDEGKRFAEALFMAYHQQYGLSVRIPRIFNTYGPRLREDGLYGRVMSRFISQALLNEPLTIYGDGTQTRSFCYVIDTVTGLMRLAAIEESDGEVVNIGNSEEVTILELARKIKELAKSKSTLAFCPLPKDDPERRCPDTVKISSLLNWKPKISLIQGLERTIEWFSLRTNKNK